MTPAGIQKGHAATRLAALIAVLLCLVGVVAQEPPGEPPAGPGKDYAVEVYGYGKNEKEACADAEAEAVLEAASAFLDEVTLATYEQQINDTVLQDPQLYITSSEVGRSERVGGDTHGVLLAATVDLNRLGGDLGAARPVKDRKKGAQELRIFVMAPAAKEEKVEACTAAEQYVAARITKAGLRAMDTSLCEIVAALNPTWGASLRTADLAPASYLANATWADYLVLLDAVTGAAEGAEGGARGEAWLDVRLIRADPTRLAASEHFVLGGAAATDDVAVRKALARVAEEAGAWVARAVLADNEGTAVPAAGQDVSVEHAKKRIAVVTSPIQWVGDEKMGDTAQIGSAIAAMAANALVKTGRFDVLERQMLDAILRERRLADTGVTDAPILSARALGAEFLVIPQITFSGRTRKDTRIGIISIDAHQVETTVAVRVVETSSGGVLWSDRAKATHKEKAGGLFLAFRKKIGMRAFAQTGLGKTVASALETVLAQMCEAPEFPLCGDILAVVDDKAYINLGVHSGIQTAQELPVYRAEGIYNSKGELVFRKEKRVGSVRVGAIQVDGAETTIANGELKEGDFVKVEAG